MTDPKKLLERLEERYINGEINKEEYEELKEKLKKKESNLSQENSDVDPRTIQQAFDGTTPQTLDPGFKLDDYEIVRLIGKGGMGKVYETIYHGLDKEVKRAIKTVPPILTRDKRALQNLKREVRIAQQLQHSNIIGTYSLEQWKDNYFIVTEYIPGPNFREYLDEKENTLTIDEIIELFSGVADALDYAHNKKQPVIHRDLKPANILYDTRDEQLKLTDFGLAREIINSISMSRASDTTYSGGSPIYMPYEQFYGEEPAPSMDQYSLGIIIYEALNGDPPFTKGNLMMQHKEKEPPQIPGVPEIAMETIRKALAKDPEDRFDTVNSFINQLKPEFAVDACPVCGKEKQEETYDCPECEKNNICIEHKEEKDQILCPTCYHQEQEEEEKESQRSKTARQEFDSAMEFFDSLAEEQPQCPICEESKDIERFTCKECGKENICITHEKNEGLCPDCYTKEAEEKEKEQKKSFQDFKNSEILQEYIKNDNEVEGDQWQEFYEKYREEFQIPDIEALNSYAEQIKISQLMDEANKLQNNQKYEKACQKYKEILKIQPENEEAQKKYETAQKSLEEAKKEKEKAEEQKEKGKQEQKEETPAEEGKAAEEETSESEEEDIKQKATEEEEKEGEEAEEKQANPSCPICGETGSIDRFTCEECNKEYICITHKREGNLCPTCAKEQVSSFQDFKDSGILEDYIKRGNKTEGEEWQEFYEKYSQEFHIPDIETLNSYADRIKISQLMPQANKLLNNQKYEEACQKYKEILKIQPENDEAQKKYEAAQQFLEEAEEEKKEEKPEEQKEEEKEKQKEETPAEKEKAEEQKEKEKQEQKEETPVEEGKAAEKVEKGDEKQEEKKEEEQEEEEKFPECPICGDTRDIKRFTCEECGKEDICVFHEKDDGLCPECYSEKIESEETATSETTKGGNTLNYIIAGILLIALLAGGFFFFTGGEESPSKEERVSRLLSTAQTQLDNNNLVQPSDSNAYKTYQQILQIDSGNTQAQQGIQNIADHFEELGDSEQSSGNYQEAISNYEIALELGEKDSIIEDKISTSKEEIRSEQTISSLLSRAESLFNQGDLSEAYNTYQEVLNRNDENSEAQSGIEEVADRYEDIGDQRRNNDEWEEAISYYQQALEVEGSSAAIEDKIETCRKEQKLSQIPDYMVRVEGGSFQMGTDSEGEGNSEHNVTLNTFYISRHEVTQEQWLEIMDSNPSYSADADNSDNRPVENVSWFDAVKFCNQLSEELGLTPVYEIEGDIVSYNPNAFGFRLPTEAEWEFAARNRGEDIRWSGTNSSDELPEYAWYYDNSNSRTHAVGQKEPNELGLYDMNGNVWEWVYDWYSDYPTSSQSNPRGPSSGDEKVLRGGSWVDSQFYCRNYYRNHKSPDNESNNYGFRIVISD